MIKPTILALGGHDPCGAGIQADISSILGCGGRPLSLVTALSAQNSTGLAAVIPQQAEQLELQAKLLLDEYQVDAIKIGVIADHRLVPTITAIIALARRHGNIPVVLDPVLKCSGGGEFADEELQQLLLTTLLPQCTVVTPNKEELLLLGKTENNKEAIQTLLGSGVTAVLVSDETARPETISNRIYGKDGIISEYHHPRLPQRFHGSGCILASALATSMALDSDMAAAFNAACSYTEDAIKQVAGES